MDSYPEFTDVPGLERLLAVSRDRRVLRKSRITNGGLLPAQLLKPRTVRKLRKYKGRVWHSDIETVFTTVSGKRFSFSVSALMRKTYGTLSVVPKPRKPPVRWHRERVLPAGEWRGLARLPGYFIFENGAVVGPQGGPLLQRYAIKKPYRKVCVAAAGKPSWVSVHVLVLEAFVGPRPHGMVGCHGPMGAVDNSITNLRWDTPEANTADRVSFAKLRRLGLL